MKAIGVVMSRRCDRTVIFSRRKVVISLLYLSLNFIYLYCFAGGSSLRLDPDSDTVRLTPAASIQRACVAELGISKK